MLYMCMGLKMGINMTANVTYVLIPNMFMSCNFFSINNVQRTMALSFVGKFSLWILHCNLTLEQPELHFAFLRNVFCPEHVQSCRKSETD